MDSVRFIDNSAIYQAIYNFYAAVHIPTGGDTAVFFLYLLVLLRPLSIFLTLFFLTGIIYCTIRIRAMMREEEEEHTHAKGGAHGESVASSGAAHGAAPANKRFEKITEHINSDNPSDWRLAVLECDIILDEMLTKMSYHGATLSDKLKSVERSDFVTIDKAWEAHRVRNDIAHQGSNFQINNREARRVVGLYEEVFREFHFL